MFFFFEKFKVENFIEVIFLLLGVGVLIPWNFFISAKPYFQSRLCDEDFDFDGDDIEFWFSVLYNGGSVLSLAFVLFFQYCYCDDRNNNTTDNNNKNNDAWYMVMVPLLTYLITFIITTVLVLLPSIPSNLFLMISLVGVLICGICTSVACSGIVGTAGLFKSSIGIIPYFNGQAVGGLMIAIANFVAILVNTSSPSMFLQENCDSALAQTVETTMSTSSLECVRYSEISWSTAGYFLLGCIVLAACMLGYQYVDQYEKRQQHSTKTIARQPQETKSVCRQKESCAIVTTRHNCVVGDGFSSGGSKIIISYDSCSFSNGEGAQWQSLPPSAEDCDDTAPLLLHLPPLHRKETSITSDSDEEEYEVPHHRQHGSVAISVWRIVHGPAISLFWTYFVTLAIFPVWTSDLASIDQCQRNTSRIRNDLFSPFSFVIFNLGDLLGRMVSSEIDCSQYQNLSDKLVLASIVRFSFFGLFLLCHADNALNRMNVQSDAFSWFVQLAFAISNGMLTNVSFCYAPQLVNNRIAVSNDGDTKKENDNNNDDNEKYMQQIASEILNLSLCLGLLCGSFFSYPFLQFATSSTMT